MKFRHTLVAASLAALAFASAAASAATVQINFIHGFWENAVPPPPDTTIVNSSPTSTISWGVPAAPNTQQSAYQFTAPPGLTVSINVPVPGDSGNVQFGTFAHLNFPIFTPFLQSVNLHVTADIVVDGVDEGVKDFFASFQHDETPNGGSPGGPFTGTCPFPVAGSPNGIGINDNGCADRVLVTTITGGDTFTVNGVTYTLSFSGFSQDNGATVSNTFFTEENNTNIAGLFAKVVATQIPTAPEPGSLALVGLAALGVAGALRRKSTK